jgi:hypothetical protein
MYHCDQNSDALYNIIFHTHLQMTNVRGEPVERNFKEDRGGLWNNDTNLNFHRIRQQDSKMDNDDAVFDFDDISIYSKESDMGDVTSEWDDLCDEDWD